MRVSVGIGLLIGASMVMVGCEKGAPKAPTATTPKVAKGASTTTKQAAKKTTTKQPSAKPRSFAFSTNVQDAKVGATGKVSLQVVPTSGYKLNPEYPWKAKVVESKTLGVSTGVYPKAKWSMDESSAKLALDVKPANPGAHKVKATVNLSVCQTGGQKKCLWFTDEPVELAINAKP